jgi:N-acetylglucosamine-6-sulfatase
MVRADPRTLPGMRFKIQRKLGFGLLAVSLVALGALIAASSASAAGRPNIVLIQADDQTASEFTPDVMPKTTKLLADHGTSFSDYIVTTALCCPSRASLITGQYAHNHGVLNNGRGGGYGALIDKGNVLPVWLQQAGYNTIHVGKFLNAYGRAVANPAEVAPGWTDWQTLLSGDGRYYGYSLSNNGTPIKKGMANRDYVTRVVTRKAVGAVRQYAPDTRPFYLQVDQRAPHVAHGNRPGRCGKGTAVPEPDPHDIHMFRDVPLPRPRAFNEANMADKPAFLRAAPPLTFDEQKKIKKHWGCALASLVGVDRSVARVFNAVKKAGEIRKTVFIYISDNGQFFGEHRLFRGKVLPYEEALHEPLVIRMPKRYRDGARRTPLSGEPVANIDLAPTILDLAQGEPCPPNGQCRVMDGRSLMPLLSDQGGWPAKRGLLTEYRVSTPRSYATCDFAGIRTGNAIYVEHYSVVNLATHHCDQTLQVERYNLKDDPQELQNLCHGGAPTSCPPSKRQVDLARRLQTLRICAGIASRDHRVDARPYCE